MSAPTITRRSTLISLSGLWVAVMAGCASIPVVPKRPAPKLQDAMAWITFVDGRYTLIVPRVEMGQHISTAMHRIACTELGAAPEQVAVVLHDTRRIGRVRATVGSESIGDFALPLARACATLREALARGKASGELQAQPIPLAELRAFAKPSAAQTWPLAQGREIVTGKPVFASDLRLPGMHYGRVLRADASPELASELLSANRQAARLVNGFIAIVESPLLTQGKAQGVGIVAATPAALDAVEAALQAQWRVLGTASLTELDIDGARRERASPRHRLQKASLSADQAWDVDIRIDVPLAAHAAIEPRCAVARWEAETMALWVGSQDVYYQADVIQKRLDLSERQVQVHGMRVGGAFGGKTICTVELEAAVLAKSLGGAVKVQWNRAQELRQGFHRPPSSHRLRARLQGGRIAEWQHHFVSSHILFTNGVLPAWMQQFTDFIGDNGVARGAALPYDVPRQDVGFDLVRLPVLTGPWRGLGAGPNGLAIESAVDECAIKAGVDPLDFRLAQVSEPRLARVLRAAAAASAWAQTPRRGQEGDEWIGRGIACGIYKEKSFAAVVAEVAVHAQSGRVRVRRMWCAHDCGRVVEPTQVRAQVEGNLVWAVGMALVEALSVGPSGIEARSFADAPIVRFADVPRMDVVLVDEGDAPSGAGETAIVCAAAAIGNAIRAASGVRVQRFPASSVLPRA